MHSRARRCGELSSKYERARLINAAGKSHWQKMHFSPQNCLVHNSGQRYSLRYFIKTWATMLINIGKNGLLQYGTLPKKNLDLLFRRGVAEMGLKKFKGSHFPLAGPFLPSFNIARK